MKVFVRAQSDMNRGGSDIPMGFYTFQIDTPDEVNEVFEAVKDDGEEEKVHFNFKPEDIPVGKPFIITVQCNIGVVIDDYCYEYYVSANLYNSIEDYIKIVEEGIRNSYALCLDIMKEE